MCVGDFKKYKDEKAWVQNEKVQFEHAWVQDFNTSGRPMEFPTHMIELNDMAKRVKDAIHSHKISSFTSID